jgi:hypothetical protein
MNLEESKVLMNIEEWNTTSTLPLVLNDFEDNSKKEVIFAALVEDSHGTLFI